MSDNILSEEEIDTLLDGVSKGEVSTDGDDPKAEVSNFDFNQQHNIIISRLPKLQTICDEFIKGMKKSLRRAYKKEVDVQLGYLHTRRYCEYQKKLPNPSNLNLVSVSPFNQPGLILLDSKLLFILVDQYFGGTGELAGRVEPKAFSPIELKMSEPFIELITEDWRRAWESTATMMLNVTGREDNPAMMQMFGINDVVLQFVFQVGFNGNYGEFQVTIPYGLLESLREKLGPDVAPDQGQEDEKWHASIAQELGVATVAVSSSIDNLSITIQELIELVPGDVLPIDMPESVCVSVEGLRMFEGRLGAFNGKNAIEIERSYSHIRLPKKSTITLDR